LYGGDADDGRTIQIRRIKIIFSGNTHQRKQRVPSGVGKRGSHTMRRRCVADRTDRPIGREPFARGMRYRRGQSNQSGGLVNRGRLYGCNFMPSKALAHQIKAADKDA
jgi:hypothetical protein